MGQDGRFAEIRLTALREGQLQIGQQPRLVALDGKQIMGLALLDQIGGERALGQQRVGGEGFAGEIQGGDQWDEGADLVGLFGGLVGSGQQADFFWVCAMPL